VGHHLIADADFVCSDGPSFGNNHGFPDDARFVDDEFRPGPVRSPHQPLSKHAGAGLEANRLVAATPGLEINEPIRPAYRKAFELVVEIDATRLPFDDDEVAFLVRSRRQRVDVIDETGGTFITEEPGPPPPRRA